MTRPLRCRVVSAMALVAMVVAVVIPACNATPLPMPPSARVDPSRMALTSAQTTTITLRGSAGAISPGDVDLRVTGPFGLSERRVRPDGSFVATLSGTLDDVLFLERVEADRDRFLIAVQRAAAGGEAVEAAPMPDDRDGDESPDAIDCAPDDGSQGGRRCMSSTCTPVVEVCNGLDDDCDGLVDDEDVCACPMPLERCGSECVDTTSDLDHCGGCDMPCSDAMTCSASTCEPAAAPCSTDADCAAGEVCVSGFCTS